MARAKAMVSSQQCRRGVEHGAETIFGVLMSWTRDGEMDEQREQDETRDASRKEGLGWAAGCVEDGRRE